MSLRLRQAALLAGVLIAGFAFGASGVGGQAPVPTVPPTRPGPFDVTYGTLAFAGQVNPRLITRPARRL